MKPPIEPFSGIQLSLLNDPIVREQAPYSYSGCQLLGSRSEQKAVSNLLPNNSANESKPDKNSDGSWIEEKYIQRSGKLHGPYRYKRWRQEGKLRSKYLGKVSE